VPVAARCTGIGVQSQEALVLATANPVGTLFSTVLVVAFFCQLVQLIDFVVRIVTVNTFFIDWEQVCNVER